MKDNPYSKIIEIIKDKGASKNPPSIQIGEVISPPPNLIIKIGDLQVDKDNILIADYLLKEHKRQIKSDTMLLPVNETGTTTVNSSHSHNIADFTIVDTYIYTKDTLKVGEMLAIMPVYDRQLYIILAILSEVS